MDFSVTNTQDELSALGRRILADLVTPDRLTELEKAGLGFDQQLWESLRAAGLLAAALPERVGGDGYGLAHQCSILIELGRAVAPAPYLESIVAGAGVLAEFGSDDQASRYAAQAAGGRLIIAPALAEPGPDPMRSLAPEVRSADASPQTALVTRAERIGAGWRLTGLKTAVPAGATAGLFLVTAATEQGTGVFCVEPSDDGVTVAPQALIDHPGAARLELSAVELAPDRLVGELADGAAAGWLASRMTLGLCASQLGVTERALELTAEYARNRQQFGRAIGAFQAVAQRLADAYIDVEAIRLTMWQAAWRLEADLPAQAELATAKFWAADGGHRVAHTAVHIHGGVGIDVSHRLHRYFTAAKQHEFALGGATAQLRHLGAMIAWQCPS